MPLGRGCCSDPWSGPADTAKDFTAGQVEPAVRVVAEVANHVPWRPHVIGREQILVILQRKRFWARAFELTKDNRPRALYSAAHKIHSINIVKNWLPAFHLGRTQSEVKDSNGVLSGASKVQK